METCYNCGSSYESTSRGALECSFHPRSFNYHHDGRYYPKNTFDCCGAKLKTGNQETIDKFNNGCQIIDHASSKEELKQLMKTPYVCIKAEDFRTLKLFRTVTVNSIEVKVSELNRTISLNPTSGKAVLVNLMDEYAKLFGATQENKESSVESSEIYYRDDDYDLANTIKDDGRSLEFFIVLRVPGIKQVTRINILN